MQEYDTILYIDPSVQPVTENYYDDRTNPAKGIIGKGRDIRFGYLKGGQGNNRNRYGIALRNQISLGNGYSVEVADYETEISVRVSYTNPATGKGAIKNFLIVFDLSKKGSKGHIKSSVAKWRSITDISQAASYIRSCSSSLQSRTSSAD